MFKDPMTNRFSLHQLFSATAFSAALVACAIPMTVQAAPKPLRVLLITGGCCHDYARQKDILKSGLEKRANVVVDQIHTDDKSTRPPLAILGKPDYAQGYDLVIHDECAADVSDPATASLMATELRRDQNWIDLQVGAYRELAQGYLPR